MRGPQSVPVRAVLPVWSIISSDPETGSLDLVLGPEHPGGNEWYFPAWLPLQAGEVNRFGVGGLQGAGGLRGTGGLQGAGGLEGSRWARVNRWAQGSRWAGGSRWVGGAGGLGQYVGSGKQGS